MDAWRVWAMDRGGNGSKVYVAVTTRVIYEYCMENWDKGYSLYEVSGQLLGGCGAVALAFVGMR